MQVYQSAYQGGGRLTALEVVIAGCRLTFASAGHDGHRPRVLTFSINRVTRDRDDAIMFEDDGVDELSPRRNKMMRMVTIERDVGGEEDEDVQRSR